jgi:hypothetical protein
MTTNEVNAVPFYQTTSGDAFGYNDRAFASKVAFHQGVFQYHQPDPDLLKNQTVSGRGFGVYSGGPKKRTTSVDSEVQNIMTRRLGLPKGDGANALPQHFFDRSAPNGSTEAVHVPGPRIQSMASNQHFVSENMRQYGTAETVAQKLNMARTYQPRQKLQEFKGTRDINPIDHTGGDPFDMRAQIRASRPYPLFIDSKRGLAVPPQYRPDAIDTFTGFESRNSITDIHR